MLEASDSLTSPSPLSICTVGNEEKKKKGYLIGRDRVILLLVKGGRIKRTLLNRMGGNGLEGN